MNEWFAMSVLALILVLVGAYYLRKSILILRRTSPAFEMLPDDRSYLRRQAWRRIVNSCLMFLLATVLVGSYLGGMQEKADEIVSGREKATVDGVKPPLTDQQRQFRVVFSAVWISTLALLGTIVVLAGIDLFATRRYALTQLRRIQSDRRAMLERQLAKWRDERDGLPPE